MLDAKTGISKGFGFAEMPDLSEATKAIQEMNGKRIDPSVVRVKRAENSSISKKRN